DQVATAAQSSTPHRQANGWWFVLARSQARSNHHG
ncbi:hypothetical protein D047_2861B, partial [Vibrio parahaemolyticus VPTS-2010_2]